MQAEEMCIYTRDEWRRGMSTLGVSSTRQLRRMVNKQTEAGAETKTSSFLSKNTPVGILWPKCSVGAYGTCIFILPRFWRYAIVRQIVERISTDSSSLSRRSLLWFSGFDRHFQVLEI